VTEKPRQLLLVANPFPPMASGGTIRLTRFCRYLPQFGWEVTVLCPNGSGPEPVPTGLRIVRTVAPTPDPAYALARRLWAARPRVVAHEHSPGRRPGTGRSHPVTGPLTSRQKRVNDWLFIPDKYAGWVPPAIAAGRRLLREQRFDAIMSSYPRASCHLVASSLARTSGLPWLADYRDPWTTNQIPRFPTGAHRRLHEALETRALHSASAVTAVNEPILDNLRRRFTFLPPHYAVITNGYDADAAADQVDLGDGFWLVHTGRLYQRLNEVRRFLEALASTPDDVQVLFLGIESGPVMAEAARAGVAQRVLVRSFAPHAHALGCQRAADALLLFTVAKEESLTGKVFEYLASGKPIFAITPRASTAERLLARAGLSAWADAAEALDEPLNRFIAEVRKGTLPPREEAVVREFDGRLLTGRLAALLDTIAG
jgi:glycosyltransferase involved in cell wall biosynthesis